jgi:hypothetical protein
VRERLVRHRAAAADAASGSDLLPDVPTIETIIDAAFWASLRREEGFSPRISLAFLPPTDDVHPLRFAKPLALEPGALVRLAPAVERQGIHLGVWPEGDRLVVWGTTRTIPAFCLVIEVDSPGLLVIKHRPRRESGKFVNIGILEGDRIKIVDETAPAILPDCPTLVRSLLAFEPRGADAETTSVLIEIAVSMRKHRRGGTVLIVPAGTTAWTESIIHPVAYPVQPVFSELAQLAARGRMEPPTREWRDSLDRAVDAIAGLTAVDGATIMTDAYELLAFGAKIMRRDGRAQIERVVVTEPVEGNVAETLNPSRLGGTRHLSAAQFVRDQHDALALVASQDGRFTIFGWSPCEETVYAHRVEVLLF